MAKWYFYFIIVGAICGALMSHAPSGRSSAPPTALADHDASFVQYSRNPSAPAAAAVSIPTGALALEREDDGHFYADAEINGSRVHILVDTGASGIALSRDDARRAGLAPSTGMSEVVGEGASGEVRGEYVTLDRVSLGGATAEDLPAVILDSGEQSLLGQSFLREFQTVEIRDDTMILR